MVNLKFSMLSKIIIANELDSLRVTLNTGLITVHIADVYINLPTNKALNTEQSFYRRRSVTP